MFGLSGLAVAQPLYEVFGASPEVFVFADASGRDLVAFALVLLLAPPLVLWGVGAAVGLVVPRAREPVHVATLALLVGLLALYVVKHFGATAPVSMVAAAGVAAALLVWLYRSRPATRSVLRYLSLGPVLFLVSFLALSPAGELLRPDGAEAVSLEVARADALPPVVVIVFDEWPLTSIVGTDGAIDPDLYPNLAALAGDSTWYRNTTTVTNSTLYAVPSILTGRLPVAGERADARSHPESLFTLLGGVYDLEAVEPITALCPTAICNEPQAPRAGADEGFADSPLGVLLDDARAVYRTLVSPSEELGGTTDVEASAAAAGAEAPPVDEARADQGEADVLAVFGPRPEGLAGLLSTIRPDEAPTVHFLHLLLPHTPYFRLPTGEAYEADEGLREVADVQGDDPSGNVRTAPQPAADLDRQRLLLQVGYVDTLIGDLVDRLERTGLYDESLIVLTSDHGTTFEAGAPARGLGPRPVEPDTMADFAWVPLIVKAPGQTEGRVDDRNALTIDVVPTVADLLGVDLPWPVDGRSLEGPPRGPHKPFHRAIGLAGADYRFEDPIGIEDQAVLADVLAAGVDTHLPRGTLADRWYAFGPRADLVGRRAADLGVGSPSALGPAQIETGASIEVRDGEALPALSVGRVNSEAPDGTLVAVTVDGTVAAVVPMYTDQFAPGRVAAMLLRATLTPGRHDVAYHEVTDTPGAVLAPIPLG